MLLVVSEHLDVLYRCREGEKADVFADHPDSYALRHLASAAIDGSQPGPCNGVTVHVGHDLCSISPRNIGSLRCSLVGEARLWTREFVGRKRLGAGQILDLFVRPACLGFWPPLVANSAQMHLDCEETDSTRPRPRLNTTAAVVLEAPWLDEKRCRTRRRTAACHIGLEGGQPTKSQDAVNL